MNNLTLIIPAKNEKESLPLLLKEIKLIPCKKKIILSKNDFETYDAIKENDDIEILFQSRIGLGSAIIEGVKNIKTSHFCILHADGSSNPKYIEEMYQKCKSNNLNFIFGSRYLKPGGGSDDDTIVTLIGNYIFTKLADILFSTNISDILFLYVLGKTESFNYLNLQSYDHRLCCELAIKAKIKKIKYDEIPIHERKRFGGVKKVNAVKDGFLILMGIIHLFFNKKNI